MKGWLAGWILTLLLYLQLLNLASGPSFSYLPLFPGGLPSFSLFLNIILAPPQSCLKSRTACLGNASWNAICSEKKKTTLHRQHFPLCPPSSSSPILARVVSTSSKGSLKMESHVQMETLRNPVPWRDDHLSQGRWLLLESFLCPHWTTRSQAGNFMSPGALNTV